MLVRRSRSALPLVAKLVFLALTISLSALAGFAERVEDLPAKPTDYISDYAHVLSPEMVARLDRLCGQLDHSAANTQIAVVTLKNLDGDDKADFANRLEEKWKVGKKGSDRSVLMLITVEDRHYWLEVGYGLEGILPDAKVGDIGRLMVPDLKQHNYDRAVATGLVQIANVVAADAKVSLQDQPPPEQQMVRRQAQRGPSLFAIIFRIVIILVVLGFFGFRGLFGFGLGMLLGGGRRGGWGGGDGGWGGGGGGGGGGGDGFGGFGGGDSGGGGAGGDY